jgi:hypothetical protein
MNTVLVWGGWEDVERERGRMRGGKNQDEGKEEKCLLLLRPHQKHLSCTRALDNLFDWERYGTCHGLSKILSSQSLLCGGRPVSDSTLRWSPNFFSDSLGQKNCLTGRSTARP